MSSLPRGATSAAKPKPLNVNSLYSGRAPPPGAKAGGKYGLQPVAKTANGAIRRMPPPAILPSLKAENNGQDPATPVVPQGGAGWSKADVELGSSPNSAPASDLRPSWLVSGEAVSAATSTREFPSLGPTPPLSAPARPTNKWEASDLTHKIRNDCEDFVEAEPLQESQVPSRFFNQSQQKRNLGRMGESNDARLSQSENQFSQAWSESLEINEEEIFDYAPRCQPAYISPLEEQRFLGAKYWDNEEATVKAKQAPLAGKPVNGSRWETAKVEEHVSRPAEPKSSDYRILKRTDQLLLHDISDEEDEIQMTRLDKPSVSIVQRKVVHELETIGGEAIPESDFDLEANLTADPTGNKANEKRKTTDSKTGLKRFNEKRSSSSQQYSLDSTDRDYENVITEDMQPAPMPSENIWAKRQEERESLERDRLNRMPKAMQQAIEQHFPLVTESVTIKVNKESTRKSADADFARAALRARKQATSNDVRRLISRDEHHSTNNSRWQDSRSSRQQDSNDDLEMQDSAAIRNRGERGDDRHRGEDRNRAEDRERGDDVRNRGEDRNRGDDVRSRGDDVRNRGEDRNRGDDVRSRGDDVRSRGDDVRNRGEDQNRGEDRHRADGSRTNKEQNGISRRGKGSEIQESRRNQRRPNDSFESIPSEMSKCDDDRDRRMRTQDGKRAAGKRTRNDTRRRNSPSGVQKCDSEKNFHKTSSHGSEGGDEQRRRRRGRDNKANRATNRPEAAPVAQVSTILETKPDREFRSYKDALLASEVAKNAAAAKESLTNELEEVVSKKARRAKDSKEKDSNDEGKKEKTEKDKDGGQDEQKEQKEPGSSKRSNRSRRNRAKHDSVSNDVKADELTAAMAKVRIPDLSAAHVEKVVKVEKETEKAVKVPCEPPAAPPAVVPQKVLAPIGTPKMTQAARVAKNSSLDLPECMQGRPDESYDFTYDPQLHAILNNDKNASFNASFTTEDMNLKEKIKQIKDFWPGEAERGNNIAMVKPQPQLGDPGSEIRPGECAVSTSCSTTSRPNPVNNNLAPYSAHYSSFQPLFPNNDRPAPTPNARTATSPPASFNNFGYMNAQQKNSFNFNFASLDSGLLGSSQRPAPPLLGQPNAWSQLGDGGYSKPPASLLSATTQNPYSYLKGAPTAPALNLREKPPMREFGGGLMDLPGGPNLPFNERSSMPPLNLAVGSQRTSGFGNGNSGAHSNGSQSNFLSFLSQPPPQAPPPQQQPSHNVRLNFANEPSNNDAFGPSFSHFFSNGKQMAPMPNANLNLYNRFPTADNFQSAKPNHMQLSGGGRSRPMNNQPQQPSVNDVWGTPSQAFYNHLSQPQRHNFSTSTQNTSRMPRRQYNAGPPNGRP